MLDSSNDEPELAVIDCVDQDHTGVRTTCDSPLAKDPRDVGDVEGDENAVVLGGELEECFVIERLELRLAVERSDVVPLLRESVADVPTRDVGVQEQPHAAALSLVLDLQERIELAQLLERTPVLAEVPLDFLGETLGVRPRQAHVALRHERVALA